MSAINPTCPTSCASTVAVVSFDFCDPNVNFGEIEKLYVAPKDAANLSDWTSATAWAARITNSGTGADDIREMHVSADLPAPERDKVDISVRRTVTTPATWTINIDIDDLGDENYEFIRSTACNTSVKVWFATQNYIYGGNTGIIAEISLDPMIERGKKSLQKASGTITWEAKFAPERTTNVIE